MEGLMCEPSIEQPTTMPECTKCGSPVEESDNFCSNCGKPQTEAAQNRLDQLIEKKPTNSPAPRGRKASVTNSSRG